MTINTSLLSLPTELLHHLCHFGQCPLQWIHPFRRCNKQLYYEIYSETFLYHQFRTSVLGVINDSQLLLKFRVDPILLDQFKKWTRFYLRYACPYVELSE